MCVDCPEIPSLYSKVKTFFYFFLILYSIYTKNKNGTGLSFREKLKNTLLSYIFFYFYIQKYDNSRHKSLFKIRGTLYANNIQ